MTNISNEQAKRVANAINDGRIAVVITSVSASGMSRKMRFHEISNNSVYPLTHLIADLCDYKLTSKQEISVKGCGMDMIFYVLDICARRLSDMGYKCKYHGYNQL